MKVMAPVLLLLMMILTQKAHSEALKYVVIGPREVRAGGQYAYTVFVEGDRSHTGVLKAILLKNAYGKDDYVVAEEDISISYGKTNFLKLDIPVDTESGAYKFEVWSHIFNSRKSIGVQVTKKVQSLLIQTDKGMYKPGQEVKFRTITFDSDLKPYKEEINITIYDKSSNKIKELINKKNDFGVITDALKLSDQTSLGTWKIEAKTKLQTEQQTFDVSEYVLPKFEVKVEAPDFFFLNNNNPRVQQPLVISATAFYTYGQPVSGIARLTVKLEKVEGIRHLMDYADVSQIHLVKGRADRELSYEKLMQQHPVIYQYRDRQMTLKVDVAVVETVTSEERTASGSVVLKQERLKMEYLANTPTNFKPGLRYYAYLSLTKIDSSPVPVNELKNSNGVFKNVTISVRTILPVFHFIPVDENGFVFLNFSTPEVADKFSIEASFQDEVSNKEVSAKMDIEKFVTKGRGSIQISLQNSEQVIKPNVNLRFRVQTVEETKRLTLQIMAKGALVDSKEVEVEEASKEHYFEVSVTAPLALKLAPDGIFVVSYVSGEGELIADSLVLNVADFMSNKVSLTFSKNETKPGDVGVVLNVRTPDSSYVGLLGVDQSVLLLNKGNDLTADKLKEELDSYSSKTSDGMRRRANRMMCMIPRPRWSNEKNTGKIFQSSGLEVLTNLLLQTERPDFGYVDYSSVEYDLDESMWYTDSMVRSSSPGSPGSPRLNSGPPRRRPGPPRPRPGPISSPVVVRKKFPETFIWSDFNTDQNGDYQMRISIPDTITSWSTTAFSINSRLGLGLSEQPAKITVVKPFFVSLKLPYSVIRGEEFALQVTVFNYHDQDIQTEVKLASSTSFKVLDCRSGQAIHEDSYQTLNVTKNDATAVYFWVVATSLGHVPLQVSAQAAVAADAMTTKLLVKPEGKAESYSTSFLMQLSNGQDFHKAIDIEIPSQQQLVEGSIKAQITLIGDVIGTSLNGIEDLLHIPSGCGEQNLVHLVPDVYLLKYLSLTNQLTPAFQKKALAFINTGYQQQLTFQRRDGSFSAFGDRDEAGSVWLSAFTIKCLHQARDFIPVDDHKLAQTIDWIINNQDSSGKFSEPRGARILDSKMQGGSSSGHALTAYTLIALIENQNNSHMDAYRLRESILKAKNYLETNHQENHSNAYNLAIISYAFFKSSSTHLNTLLTAINQLATQKEDMKYWQDATDSSSDAWTCTYSRATSYSIELASYMLALHSQQRNLHDALPIAKWILTQRNAFGGFSSTQDTVLALEALTSFGSLFGPSFGNEGIRLSVTHEVGTQHFDTVNKDNALILQSYELPTGAQRVLLDGSGSGAAVVQMNVNYNVKVAHNNNLLSLSLHSQQEANNVVLEITTSWTGTEVSGMVLVEVSLLTGHSMLQEEHTTRMIGNSFKKIEKSDDKVVFYLDELTSTPLSFRVYMTETLKVANVKPAHVKVFRYYDTQHTATSFYSTQAIQSWQSVCPLCCQNLNGR